MDLLSFIQNRCSLGPAFLRGAVSVLVFGMLLIGLSTRAVAGCHYSDGRSFAHKHSDNPREHARNFRFLGQWVYEKGEIKYVPWRAAQPCQGPHCRSEKPAPVTALVPSNSLQRLPTVLLIVVKASPFCFDSQTDWSGDEDREPLAGFAQELEHPPKASFCA